MFYLEFIIFQGTTEGPSVLYDWLSSMEKTCHHIAGKEHVFGAELKLDRGLPVIVEKCAIFLMAHTTAKDLFLETGNRALVDYFRLQFDQGNREQYFRKINSIMI